MPLSSTERSRLCRAKKKEAKKKKEEEKLNKRRERERLKKRRQRERKRQKEQEDSKKPPARHMEGSEPPVKRMGRSASEPKCSGAKDDRAVMTLESNELEETSKAKAVRLDEHRKLAKERYMKGENLGKPQK